MVTSYMIKYITIHCDTTIHNLFSKFLFSFRGNCMEQTGPKHSQFRKLEYLQETLLQFLRPSGRTVFNCYNPKGVKLLTRISHFREHQFKHSFQDSFNPTCTCGETSDDFLLHSPNYSNDRSAFLNIIESINRNILTRSDFQVTKTLLYGKVIQTI